MQQDPGPACSSKADNLILYILCSLSFLLWRMQHKLNSEFWNVKLTNLKHNLKPMWAFFTHIFFYICQVETFKVCLVSLLYWKCNLASNHNNEMLETIFFFLALTSPNNFKFRLSKSLSCVPKMKEELFLGRGISGKNCLSPVLLCCDWEVPLRRPLSICPWGVVGLWDHFWRCFWLVVLAADWRVTAVSR